MTLRYEFVTTKQGNNRDLADRITTLATVAWQGFNSNSVAWRRSYNGSLAEHPLSERLFALFGFHDHWDDTFYDFGFSVILPMSNDVADLHIAGKLDQYDFKTDWLKSDPALTTHYFQSLFIDNALRSNPAAKRVAVAGIESLLQRQGCGADGQDFRIYAELGFSGGIKLADRFGFSRRENLSYHGNPIAIFESAAASSAAAKATCHRIQALHS